MSSKVKRISLILLAYLISLVVCELIFALIQYKDEIVDLAHRGLEVPLNTITTVFKAGFCHLICVLILALYIRTNKKVSKTTKNVIYILPCLTILLTIPVADLIGTIIRVIT